MLEQGLGAASEPVGGIAGRDVELARAGLTEDGDLVGAARAASVVWAGRARFAGAAESWRGFLGGVATRSSA
ncbi:hypothetical protein Pth03_33560 [Planotetraspora thailandica]|uniref:Uncharacterized protein n=1 Tax=Planotetraspora thailandica TaxID=487172 RepID=A0A8J3XU23_9ACTN|nr:hypothetical protein Pth03_33560 [Planotetraspora thailandica]